MKVKVNTIAMLTMVTVGFTTVATSCSNDDVPASYQPSVLAKSLEGEWIVEQHIDGIEGLGKMAENIYIPEDADQFAILYHFNNDGTGWKELDLLKNGKVESILISRYDSQFVYTVSNEGKVSLNYTDADGKMNGQKAELLFDGKILTDKAGDIPVALNPSTEAQIKTYQEEADAWHGGSDDAALGHALFDSVVGEIVGSDGKAYAATAKNNLPKGVTAVAMVAYRGSETDDEIFKRGIAIALTDGDGKVDWQNAGEMCSYIYKDRVDNSHWRLPSVKDWEYMFIGCGSGESYSEPSPNMIKNCSALANKLITAGGTALQNDAYWTSTELHPGKYIWTMNFGGSSARTRIDYEQYSKFRVRACLIF